ncbi:MAG TPA: aminotransferase class V-fold PLP-dependent enzyme [Thermomicrobiales bacterium]|nr:aminotransferase class V-fold PLP-dependent enzyme [Thermomicrobiales bacterium]
MTAPNLRDEFLLDPEVVFLNHGSFGATPKPVFDDDQRWQRELERQPVEFLGRRSEALLDEARADVARYLGAEPRDLVFVPNATTGVNIVARSLALDPGDEILTTDLEYGACDRAWDEACRKAGARVIRMPIALPVGDPAAVVDAVWQGATPRTRVLYLSHITSGTALTLPIEPLIQRAREAGVFTVIDGAHAPGHIPVDLTAIGADAYSGNLHKWLCAPKGAGVLHVRREHHAWMGSDIVSWGWVEESDHFRDDDLFVSRNAWQGTRDVAAYLAAPAAIRYQAERDWPSVRARCHDLVSDARRRIGALTGLPPAAPEPAEADWPWFCQMAIAPLPPVDARELKRRLYDEFRVEVPITQRDGQAYIRVSIQGYNTASDVDALLNALERLLPEVALR